MENLRTKRERLATLYREQGYPRDVSAWTEERVERMLAVWEGRASDVPDPAKARSWEWTNRVLPRLVDAGLPVDYRREILPREWDCEEQRRIYGVCRRKCLGVGSTVVLWGERGLGKTTIGAQCLIAEAWEGRTGAYRKLSDLLKFKPLYTDQGTICGEDLERERLALVRRRLIVLDEVHEVLKDTRTAKLILTDLIDRRYANQKDTILITNQSGKAFSDSMDDSVLSRIAERGRIIPCAWPNWRLRIAQKNNL